MEALLGLFLVLFASFGVGSADSTPADSTTTWVPPVTECPVCSCRWEDNCWKPVNPSCGQCKCSGRMCNDYLRIPGPGDPLECPWYGCPSGMPGPPSPSSTPADTSTTWVPPVTECPVCFCKWEDNCWRPINPSSGECKCTGQMCTGYLRIPEPGDPLECPWYGCPSGMPGPPSTSSPDVPDTTETVEYCSACTCYWAGHKWLPVAVTEGRCPCNEEMCGANLKPPKDGDQLRCAWFGCPSADPGPPEWLAPENA